MTEAGSITKALTESLAEVDQKDPRDEAARALARRYAELLDAALGTEGEADVFNALGPKYLAVLTALGMTPAGRGVKAVKDERPSGNPLDELRARRARRAGAAVVDSASS